eukprot:1179535-Prorocentrum_minimum.AAC.1
MSRCMDVPFDELLVALSEQRPTTSPINTALSYIIITCVASCCPHTNPVPLVLLEAQTIESRSYSLDWKPRTSRCRRREHHTHIFTARFSFIRNVALFVYTLRNVTLEIVFILHALRQWMVRAPPPCGRRSGGAFQTYVCPFAASTISSRQSPECVKWSLSYKP